MHVVPGYFKDLIRTTHTHTHLMALFVRDYLREPVPER